MGSSSSAFVALAGGKGASSGTTIGAHLDRVRHKFNARGLAQERLRDGAQRDPCCSFPCRRALEYGTRVIKAVFGHSDEVRVAGTRPSERRASRAHEFLRRHRIRGHHGLPLWPFGVAHHDRDRSALGEPVPHSAKEGDLVLLERHPRATSIAEPTARERLTHSVGRDGHASGQTLERANEGRAVRFTCSKPPEHDRHSFR